ncbi:MAG: CRISPR-associated endonuclease Cas2 [Gammaproteobacteria bacterium]
MLILVTYDVSTETAEGRRRLRRVAKACLNYGQRVQKSVFECRVDQAGFEALRRQLLKEIEGKRDSLRFYRLSEPLGPAMWEYGTFKAVDFEGPLIV